MLKVKRALISVSDKKGIVPFARKLHELGVEILSTGGTARQMAEAGIPVVEIGDYTGFPEMMDGRLKTLHPKVHGGILALREKQEHIEQLRQHDIDLIDMVVVNLYPFESVTKKKNVALADAIENIDIGGPTMLRAAAKNYKSVAVVCNPARYQAILRELDVNNGLLSDTVLFHLGVEAFSHTAHYDTVISSFLTKRVQVQELEPLPQQLHFKYEKARDLRYGENPHQKGSFYKSANEDSGLAKIKQKHGKELSFNNILDLNAAIDFIKDLDLHAAVVIKHNNPTGVAQDKTLEKAYKGAWSCDKISAFGGIIGFNSKVDVKTAQAIAQSGFMECVIAPAFAKDAFKHLSRKKNIRLIELNLKNLSKGGYDLKSVHGGILVQEKDELTLSEESLKVPTRKKPTKGQLESARFGWAVIKNVKSNAIILVKGNKTVGIGCGQTSRVESVHIAIGKAGKRAKGSVLISDAFLPHIDNVQLAAEAGITCIVQTGGSIADEKVIKEADTHGIAMVMTGVRHFKH